MFYHWSGWMGTRLSFSEFPLTSGNSQDEVLNPQPRKLPESNRVSLPVTSMHLSTGWSKWDGHSPRSCWALLLFFSRIWTSALIFFHKKNGAMSTLHLPGVPQSKEPECLEAYGRAHKTEIQFSLWQPVLLWQEISRLSFVTFSLPWYPIDFWSFHCQPQAREERWHTSQSVCYL